VSKTIWKQTLVAAALQRITVPFGSEFLCAREQFEEICVWFRCDPANAGVTREIAVVGTGHVAPEDGRYLGTVSLQGGALMFHVFERVAL
jgi:hypothetical protein